MTTIKKVVFFIMVLLCLTDIRAQQGRVHILTEKQLPLAKRENYINQAKDFLSDYYGVLHFAVDNLITQQSLKRDYLMVDSENYQPEFVPVIDSRAEGLSPDAYMQELTKLFVPLSREAELSFRVSDMQVEPQFYAPDITSFYLVINYTLELYSDEKRLFKRRCQAYCLFPSAMNLIEVRLLQVKPLHDLVAYSGSGKDSEASSANMSEKPEWASKFDFYGKPGFDGRRIICSGNKFGVVTEDGDIIVPLIYDLIGFRAMEKDNIFKNSGRIIAENFLSNIIFGSQGPLWDKEMPLIVMRGGKYGYINTEGNEIVKPIYDGVPKYLDGVTCVQQGDKYGALDATGKVVIPVKYDEPMDFSSKRDWAMTRLGKHYGFVHRDGKKVIPFTYEGADVFEGGLAAVVADGKVGFIGEDGKMVIPYKYESVWNRKGKKFKYNDLYRFCPDGTAIVKLFNKMALIDKDGKELTPFTYENIVPIVKFDEWEGYEATTGSRKVYVDHFGKEHETKERCLGEVQRFRYKVFQEAITDFDNKRYDLAFPVFERFAMMGYLEPMFLLALHYYWGWGTEKNIEEAVKWWKKAAENGHAPSQRELSVCYRNGEVVEQDMEKALEWLRKAAENGSETAMFDYADKLETGENIAKDEKAAMAWFEKLSDKGHVRGKVRLARMLWTDRKDIGDYEKAYGLFTEAAAAGDMEAVMYLGKSHYYGHGVTPDYAKAYEYFIKAEPEQTEARYFLGWMNEYGQGTKKDIRAACQWYAKCGRYRDAEERLKNLNKKL